MSRRAPSLTVVIPAFNEAARIGRTLGEWSAHLAAAPFAWDIRVVDDGSEDATRAIVAEAASRDARLVLQAEPHGGKGAAVRAGMLAATGDLRFMCDADLSMPLHELARFLAAVPADCDVAIGSREGMRARRVGEPAYRHIMGRVFNRLVQAALGLGIDDTQCGFKLFTAAAAEAVFRHVTIAGWAFDIEALCVARRLDLRVREIPIEWHYREHTRVSPVRDALRMARDVARVRGRAARGAYPRATDP
jgi:glycosyltransferase involved in cell wall biosynthesis